MTYTNVGGETYGYLYTNIDDLQEWIFLGDYSWATFVFDGYSKSFAEIVVTDELGLSTTYSVEFPCLSWYNYLDETNSYNADIFIDIRVEANEHPITYAEAVPPTCTTAGVTEGKRCDICGEILVMQEILPAFGHTVVTDHAVSPTCTTAGFTEGRHCSVCYEIFEAQETINALGHVYENKRCTVCGAYQPSEGLAFEFNAAKNGYTVVGIGTCLDTDIVIPDTYNGKAVTSIAEEAFLQQIQISSVVIPGSVTIIGANAFNSCTALTNVILSDGLLTIGDGAFSSCTALASITIPESVTAICSYAFAHCNALTSITIPESVTHIDYYAFEGCNALTSIYCEATAMPEGWDIGWIYNCSATVYWGSR